MPGSPQLRPLLILGALIVALASGGCGNDAGTVELVTNPTDTAVGEVTFTDVVTGDTVVADTAPADTAVALDTIAGDTAPADTEPPLDTAVAPDTAVVEDVGPDTTAPADTVVADTTEPTDTAQADTTEPPGPLGFVCDGQGGQGCACGGMEDCGLGLACAETALGQLCAEPCLATCAGDRRCAAAAAGFNICLPTWSTLCAPCGTHQDCLELGALCVDFGFGGSYCAPPCADGESCPDGFDCLALGGGGSPLCVPSDGQCGCTEIAVTLGMSTVCHAENGTACAGERECTAEGLTDCTASTPKTEVCNGEDDDCDGVTDEGFDLGAACAAPSGGCADGVWACTADGGRSCLGASGLVPDVCDGVDNDCDGTTDNGCDADGDDWCAGAGGVGVTSPACPNGFGDCNDSDPSRHPQAAEACNGVDDDCDGTTDGQTQSCQGGCGSGTQTCTAGGWSACSAPGQLCSPSDPCCQASGCAYEAATLKCSATATATERRCSGTCGGTVQKRSEFKYCTGSAAGCGTSNLKWDAWANETACGASNLCTQSGTSASCQSCPMGCSSGACVTQPTYKICIDPGYGPGDSPVSGGVAGNDVTWSVAQHLKTWLEADTAKPQGGGTWSVVLTRSATSNPSSTARRDTCNAAGATRVISIGVNGFNGSAHGSETYRKTTSDATWTGYATKVQAQLIAHGGLTDRGVKTSTFTILNTNAPSVWAFLGFLDNSGDRAQLANDAWRNEVAKGFLFAIQQSLGYSAYTP
jgi:N-acetylmuramoyl-L-alanine amidase